MTARLRGSRYHGQSLEVPHTKLSGWMLVLPIPQPHFIHFSLILEKLIGMPGTLLLHLPMEKERSLREIGGDSSLGMMPISLWTQNLGTGEWLETLTCWVVSMRLHVCAPRSNHGALGYRNRTDLPSGISARVNVWETVLHDLEKLMALYFTVP